LRVIYSKERSRAAAALTPRVRILAVCDEAFRSEIEDSVFTLEGVRHQFSAESFPCIRTLNVYLLLSYPRSDTFEGDIQLIVDGEDRTIRYAKFTATFANDADLLALVVEMENCVIPEPGEHRVEVRFWTDTGDVIKGEHPFRVWQLQE
jgi:hypothetical protein